MSPQMHWHRKRYRHTYELDRLIDDMDLAKKNIIGDSNCLFRVVSDNVFQTQRLHDKVRDQCVRFMESNKERFSSLVDGSFEDYVKELSFQKTFGGFTEISVMSHLYRRDFLIISSNDATKCSVCNDYGNPIYLLFYKDTKHFDALFKKELLYREGFCQSIVYEIIYGSVFNMTNIFDAVNKILEYTEVNRKAFGKNTRVNIREFKNEPKEDSEKEEIFPQDNTSANPGDHFTRNKRIDAMKQFEKGKLPFPYTVARALHPNVYKNVELNVWKESSMEKKSSDSLALQVGLKCLCRLLPDDDILHQCYVQEIDHKKGTSVVFVEEVGEKRTLASDQLEPLPDTESVSSMDNDYYDRGYLTMNQILNHLRNLKINNLQKYRNKTKKSSGAAGRDLKTKDHRNGTYLEPDFRKYTSHNDHSSEGVDRNNNFILEEESRRSSVDSNVDRNNATYMDSYTQIDYSNFEPCQVEMIAMPIIVEQNSDSNESSSPQEGGAHSNNSIQNGNTAGLNFSMMVSGIDQNTSQYVNPPPSPGTNSSTMNTGASTIVLAGGPNVNSAYPPYIFISPRQHQSSASPLNPVMPPPRFCPPPLPPSPTVNGVPQRSVALNGSDLPYHDVATLRYYFNLGIDWTCFTLGWGTPPTPFYPPPQTSRPNASSSVPVLQTPCRPPTTASLNRPPVISNSQAYQHQQRFSPDEIATDMQMRLSLEDSPDMAPPPDQKKPFNGKPNGGNHVQKNSNNNTNGNGRGVRSTIHSSRYRGRNDGIQDKNNNKNIPNKGYCNLNNGMMHHRGGRLSRNDDYQQSDIPNSSRDGKDENCSDESFPFPPDHPSPLHHPPDMSFVSYPPPPLYRYPYYQPDNEGSVTPTPYASHYMSYPHDDGSTQAEQSYSNPVSPLHSQAQYVNLNFGYFPLHQQMFFPPQPPSYTTYFSPNLPDTESHSK